jgi:hypothetical protein
MLKGLVCAVLFCGAVGLAGSSPASAMPVDDLAAKVGGDVESVAWVCKRHRCWRVPGYRSYAFVPGFRFYIGPRHRYHHWRRW